MLNKGCLHREPCGFVPWADNKREDTREKDGDRWGSQRGGLAQEPVREGPALTIKPLSREGLKLSTSSVLRANFPARC